MKVTKNQLKELIRHSMVEISSELEGVNESTRRRFTVKEVRMWMKKLEENRYKKVYNSDARRVAWMVNNENVELSNMPKSMIKKWTKAQYGRERYLAKEFLKSKSEKLSETKKRDYKAEYKKFQSSTKSKKYRAELNKYNRQKGTYGNGDKKDASHKGGKIVGFEEQSKNRGRREKSRLKKEQRVRISTMKDANFTPGMVQLLGKKGKLGMDRKSVSALVKAVRSTLGRSFTTHEVKEEKLTEAKMVTLPNGVKVKIEFKGITLQAKGRKPVFLDRSEMMTFFKATSKYMKIKEQIQNTIREKLNEQQLMKIMLDKKHRSKHQKVMMKYPFKSVPKFKIKGSNIELYIPKKEYNKSIEFLTKNKLNPRG